MAKFAKSKFDEARSLAQSVSLEKIAANDYNLSVTSYVEAEDTREVVDIAKLNAAVIAAQEKTYTLKTCPVSGESLTAMGEPLSMVLANRLVKLCCNNCKKKLAADPAEFIAMIDAAAGRSELKHHEDGDAGHAEGAGAEHAGHDAGGESAHSE